MAINTVISTHDEFYLTFIVLMVLKWQVSDTGMVMQEGRKSLSYENVNIQEQEPR